MIETGDPTVAYFSPFTRAWELALGALVAVATPWLLRIPRVAACHMGRSRGDRLPASASAPDGVPRLAGDPSGPRGGLVIAGGMGAPVGGRVGPRAPPIAVAGEALLFALPVALADPDHRRRADREDQPSDPRKPGLALLALALSVVTYTLVENPIRHARVLSRGLAPIALGAVLIAATLVLCTVALNSEQSNVARRVPPVSASALSSLLRRAPEMQTLPTDLTPSLAEAHQDWGGPPSACSPGTDQTSIPNTCIFGDSSASRTMVMYGDSHAGMWFDALNVIAKEAHWRLVDLWKGGCPVDSLTYRVPPGSGKPGTPWVACEQWQRWALGRINSLNPNLLVLTQELRVNQDAKPFTFQQWGQGLTTTFHRIHIPRSRVVVLGNIPFLPDNPPECLARHSSNIQACSGRLDSYVIAYNQVEEEVAHSAGARYINVVPWFCSTVCTGVVGHYEVYFDQTHVGATYTYVLENVLKNALGI